MRTRSQSACKGSSSNPMICSTRARRFASITLPQHVGSVVLQQDTCKRPIVRPTVGKATCGMVLVRRLRCLLLEHHTIATGMMHVLMCLHAQDPLPSPVKGALAVLGASKAGHIWAVRAHRDGRRRAGNDRHSHRGGRPDGEDCAAEASGAARALPGEGPRAEPEGACCQAPGSVAMRAQPGPLRAFCGGCCSASGNLTST